MATLWNLPPVIGHRGAAAHAPENTLASFRAAHAFGCRWVEFDVRLTGDGTLVVCHDDRLGRTTDGKGRVSRMTLDAIRERDAGGWFDAAFAGVQVPTLAETLDLCVTLGLGANIEIKAERGQARATAAALAACLAQSPRRLPPLLISSFLREAVAEAAARLPDIPRGMLWRRIPRDWRRIADDLGCATVHAAHDRLDAATAGDVGGTGRPLLAYTVNDPDRARQLFRWGIASVFSDAPGIILAALAEDGPGARRGAL